MESTLIFYVFKNFYRTAIKIFDTSHYQQFTPPFDLPDSWEWVRLGDISEIKGGTTIPTEQECSEGILPYIKVSDLNTQENIKEITTSNRYVNEWKESHVISKDSIVFPKRGGAIFTNKKRITRQPLLADLNLMSVHPLGCFEYVYLWFDSFKLSTIQSGSNIPQINNQDLEPLYIPLPPEKEQTRIVCTVSKLLDIIDILSIRCSNLFDKINIAKSKILELAMQGKLVPQDSADEPAADMLCRINPKAKIITDTPHYPKLPDNWVLTTIGDIFKINPKNKVSDDTTAAFIPMNAIHDGFSDSFSYEERDWKDIKSGFTHFANGDVAVAKISPCLENRKSMILRNLPNGIGAGTTELLVFRSEILLPEFSLLFFKSDIFINSCTGTFNGVVGQQRVGKNIVEEIAIPIPPISTQKKIINIVKQWFILLDKIQVSLLN